MNLIGRDSELERIEELLRPGMTLALVGPSGIGKTTIARHVAASRSSSVIVDCFGRDAHAVASALLERLGLPESMSTDEAWVLIADELAQTALLLLDDVTFELSVLDTLRRNWTGELLVTAHHAPDDVAVLPLGPLEVGSADDFEMSAALALFRDTAVRENGAFSLGPGDTEVVLRIAEAVHGHPLALALAARRAATTSPRTVLGLLEEPDAMIDPSRPGRQRSVDAALRFSWSRLDEGDKRRMFVMSLFARPLRPEALAELCGDSIGETLEAIRRLVRSGFAAPGEFPRPLELFGAVAREEYPAEFPADARTLQARSMDRAAALAREVPTGLADHSQLGEGPSFWQFVIEREGAGLDDDELDTVLAAWFRWYTLRSGARGEDELATPALSLLERRGLWNAWLQASRGRLHDAAAAAPFLARCQSLARSAQEIRDTAVLRAYATAMELRIADAIQLLDSVSDLGNPRPLEQLIRIDVLVVAGRWAQAREVLEDLDTEQFVPATRPQLTLLRGLFGESPEAAARLQERAAREFRDVGRIRSSLRALVIAGATRAMKLDDLQGGLALLAEARELAGRIGDEYGRTRGNVEEAQARLHHRDFDGTIRLVDDVRRTGLSEFRKSAELLNAIARWQLGRGEPDEWARQRENWLDDDLDYYAGQWRLLDIGLAAELDVDDAARLAAEHGDARPDFAPIFEAVVAAASIAPAAGVPELLEFWLAIENGLSIDVADPAVRQAEIYLEGRLPPFLERVRAQDIDADVVVLNDFAAYRAGDTWHDLTSQPVGQALLRALVETDEPLSHEQLGEELYPGEIVTESALKNRINVQISKLRKAGLKPFLAKRTEGFVLEGDVHLEDEPSSPPGD